MHFSYLLLCPYSIMDSEFSLLSRDLYRSKQENNFYFSYMISDIVIVATAITDSTNAFQ